MAYHSICLISFTLYLMLVATKQEHLHLLLEMTLKRNGDFNSVGL